ncbi:DUF2520 domain-containing protein [candidate division WOR-3 bacterium]|nr:DUF2520 domain-containing protein [candidate division WOR-3 bacterium]
MRFALCGAGRVGTSLAESLKSANWEFLGYYSISYPEWVEENEKLSDPRQLDYKDLLVILALPDKAIEFLSGELPSDLIVGHTSGSLNHMAINAPYPRARFSLHPLCSISTYGMDLSGGFWGIEGDSFGILTARRIVSALKGRAFYVESDKKPLYHLASVVSSNLMNSLLYIGNELFASCGLEEDIAFNLGESTLKNIKDKGYVASLTGPIERGDYDTLKRDLEALKGFNPSLLPMISELLMVNLKIAKEKGLSEEDADSICSIISNYKNS